MNRRQLLATAGVGIGGLSVTAVATRDLWRPFDGRLRLGLAPVVPSGYREADRRLLTDQLDTQLPALTDVRLERAQSEWHLLEGLADDDYDVVELGAIAATAALDADLVEPLVWPELGGGDDASTYEGQLVRSDPSLPDPIPADDWIAVGDPLSTPAHAALAHDGTGSAAAFPAQVRWHSSPPWAALADDRVSVAATDEFHAPSSLSVHRSYPMPVPALYVRRGVGDLSRLRERFAAIEGRRVWYLNAHAPESVPSDAWLGDVPTWLADVGRPSRRSRRPDV